MVKVAVGQLCSTGSIEHNLILCKALVAQAADNGAKALFLPEATDYIAASTAETLALAVPVHESAFVQGLKEEAKKMNIAINVGIHEPSGKGKVKNTLIWIDEEGEIAYRYQKQWMCGIKLANPQATARTTVGDAKELCRDIANGPTLKESSVVEEGNCIVPPLQTCVGKIGFAICFDLRFPEISLSLRRQGSQILTYPSAFTVATGEAHWELLLRARAIETQCYVIAAAQVGQHNDKRTSYGHSMIVNPWGKVIEGLGAEGGPDIITAEIDLGLLESVRESMPLQRRNDIYPQL